MRVLKLLQDLICCIGNPIDRGVTPALVVDEIVSVAAEKGAGSLAFSEIPSDVACLIDELRCPPDRNSRACL
jgi:hypothetical protein